MHIKRIIHRSLVRNPSSYTCQDAIWRRLARDPLHRGTALFDHIHVCILVFAQKWNDTFLIQHRGTGASVVFEPSASKLNMVALMQSLPLGSLMALQRVLGDSYTLKQSCPIGCTNKKLAKIRHRLFVSFYVCRKARARASTWTGIACRN